MIDAPRNTLVSFHYFAKFDLDRLAPTVMIGDSGAYSALMQGATITTKQLVAWGQQWRHRLAWLACLDVHGEPDTTRRNWAEMVDAGLPGVPTMHLTERSWREDMDWYAEQGVDFMGLGGLAGSGSMVQLPFRWLVQVFKYAQANHPQMRFHGWGVSRPSFLRLPWFSVDSSGWGAAYRYARLALRHPHTGETIAVELDGKQVYRPEIALLLRDHYGVNPSQVAKSGPHNRLLMVELCAKSVSVQEAHWRRMFRNQPISAPEWGRLGSPQTLAGPHLHLAEGHSEHLEVVALLAQGRSMWQEKAFHDV